MDSKTFKYNAFISYRHNDLDKYVAENLQKLIETYKMPEAVVEKYHITDNNFRRLFRDQDELPLASNLEDPIVEALKESEFLIIICSPRLKESKWCKKEIETFIKMHGRNNILCVLIEGEPDESFPEILRFREEVIKTKTGKERIKKVPCEPLAMDVRGETKNEVYKNLKKELVRVIAPMYNLDYDDIKRRHEERELKKRANRLKIIAVVSIIFAIYSFILFSKIYLSNKELKYDQSINLANRAMELLNKDNRIGAVETAYQSITEYNGISMPKTAEGISTLTNSLLLYYHDEKGYYPTSQLETSGDVKNIIKDSSWRYLLSYDTSGDITLWDVETEKKIVTVSDTISSSYNMEGKMTFIGKKHFAYINKDTDVCVFDFTGKEIVKLKTSIGYYLTNSKLNASSNGKYLSISTGKKISIYETESYKEIATYEVSKDLSIVDNQYFDSKEENIAFATKRTYADYGQNNLNVITYNISKKKIVSNYNIKASEVLKIIFKDDNIVLLTRKVVNSHTYGSDMLLTCYNFKTGKKYYYREYLGYYGSDMELAYAKDGDTALLLASGDKVEVVNYKTGKTRMSYTIDYNEVLIQPISGGDGYFQIINTFGDVFNISIKTDRYDDPTVLADMYHFNLPSYSKFLYTNAGYVGISNHSASGNKNRIIIYGRIKNNDVKEIEFKEDSYKYNKLDYNDLSSSEIKTIADEYDLKNKNLISSAFYTDDKSLLFISYSNQVLEIYNNVTKKIIKVIDKVAYNPNVYIGRTASGEYIIRGNYCAYILNKDLSIVAYIPAMVDYIGNKVIIKSWNKYYEMDIYSEKDIISKAEEFLKEKGR